MLLSPLLYTVTSSSFCILCMCLGCWGVDHACIHPMDFLHTALKWFCFPHVLHVFQNSRHCMCLCTAPQYLQLSILSFYTVLWAAVHHLSWLSCSFVHNQSLTPFFISLNAFFCTLCTSTHCAHISTCSPSISLMWLQVVSSFIISFVISLSFMSLINCSLSCLSCSL